jgi:bifunctional non-homologous end joining protein LigD
MPLPNFPGLAPISVAGIGCAWRNLRPALSQWLRPVESCRSWSENPKTAIQFSESFELDGLEMYQHACSVGLEVVVSKGRNSRYPAGRANDRVKKTHAQRETLRIAGFALKANKFDGIYLGRRNGNDLVCGGEVGHGFDKSSTAALAGAPQTADPQNPALRQEDRASRHSVEPNLLAEIEYRAKSAEGKPRHLFFKGLGEDL